jgi:hypothetical protein
VNAVRGRWLTAAAVVVGVAALMYGRTRTKRPSASPATDDGESLGEMREEIARLRGQVRNSEALAGAAMTAAADRGRLSEKGERPGPQGANLDKPKSVTLPQTEVDRRTDERFFREGTDSAWSVPAEVIARKQVALTLPEGAEIRSIECRSTMCRSTLAFPSRASHDEATTMLLRTVGKADWVRGGLAWSELRETLDGRFEQTEYLFRDGQNPVRDIYDEEMANLAASNGQN